MPSRPNRDLCGSNAIRRELHAPGARHASLANPPRHANRSKNAQMNIQALCNVFLKTPRLPARYILPGRARELDAGHQPAAVIRVVSSTGGSSLCDRSFSACVCSRPPAAAKVWNSPTSPTSKLDRARFGPAQTEARGGTDLPFRGSYTSVIEVPPPSAVGTVEGTATHLGRFTGTVTAEVTGQFGYWEIHLHCGERRSTVWHLPG